jgi:hypothetical protein
MIITSYSLQKTSDYAFGFFIEIDTGNVRKHKIVDAA